MTEEEKKLSAKEKKIVESLSDSNGNLSKTSYEDATTEIHVIKKEKKRIEKLHKDEKEILRFSPSYKDGLTTYQVEERIKEKLVNRSSKGASKSYFKIFLTNTFTFFNILILIVAASLIFAGSYNDLFFLLIAFANWLIGFVQECRAKYMVDKLKLVSDAKVEVVRNSTILQVDKTDVVLDDIIIMKTGYQSTVDAIVVDGFLEMNESLLTGESLPVKKYVGDKIYAGSFVVSGSAYCRADVIGDKTFVSSLEKQAKKFDNNNSILYKGINTIIKRITLILIPLAIILGFVNFRVTSGELYDRVVETIRTTAGSIIGMIPSGMFLLTSMALAVGVINLAKRKTLVQNLYCIEMLARTNVLCLDKTGTLTDGTMAVDEYIKKDDSVDADEIIKEYLGAFDDDNATSIALKNKFGAVKRDYVDILPFSSSRKFSAVEFEKGKTYILGAPEYVSKCLDEETSSLIESKQKNGLRALLLARYEGDISSIDNSQVTSVALFFLVDHIRDDAIETINWFKNNGVEIKIISGDNPYTVSEIAKRVGVKDAEKCISLENKDLYEVSKYAKEFTVFGRVTPDQKSAIISSLKLEGKIVSMTGDGVNDILAMKTSDCSIAMANGSDATKSVASLVLLNSSFASMPKVVEEGRRVVNNIQLSSSLFLMKTFFTIFLSLIICLSNLFGEKIPYPFYTSNMMIIEIFIIGSPSFFLALQPNKDLIEGNFLANILKKAAIGFVCLLTPTIIALIMRANGVFEHYGPNDMDAFRAFAVIGVNLAGVCMLFRVCKPFNLYRIILFVFFSIASIVLTFVLPSQIIGIDIKLLDKWLWIGEAILCFGIIPYSFAITKSLKLIDKKVIVPLQSKIKDRKNNN